MNEILFSSKDNVPMNIKNNSLDEKYFPPLVDKEKIISIKEDNKGWIVVFFDHPSRGDYGICYCDGEEWHYRDPVLERLKKRLNDLCKSKSMRWTYK